MRPCLKKEEKKKNTKITGRIKKEEEQNEGKLDCKTGSVVSQENGNRTQNVKSLRKLMNLDYFWIQKKRRCCLNRFIHIK